VRQTDYKGNHACHCYSTRLTLLAAKDWRRLGFCN